MILLNTAERAAITQSHLDVNLKHKAAALTAGQEFGASSCERDALLEHWRGNWSSNFMSR